MSAGGKGLIILAFIVCSSAVVVAKPAESFQVQKAVQGWLRSGDNAFGITLGRHSADITVYIDANKEPLYYIVHLRPSGFVIVAADDEVEPIIGFSGSGSFDPSSQNPLRVLVTRDLPKRIANARKVKISSVSTEKNKKVSREATKWAALQLLADSSAVMSISVLSDIRVSPLMQSQWNQGTVCDNNCYNYYTPNNYKCGCVATAMAQLMRFHCHPAGAVGTAAFTIYVNGVNQTASLRGGDGVGGPYIWDQMPLIPDCSTTAAQYQAIGTLCHDAGIVINTNYGQHVSTAPVRDAKNALITTFQYTGGVYGSNGGQNIGENLIEMINPNLDAGYPVILSIGGDEHSVVADGYGYDLTTLYHHINMGHSGIDDTWYNLPDFDYPYNDIVDGCIYNLYVTGSGEIISGRVTTSYGAPISDVMITATANGNVYTAVTNSHGIYALVKVP
ncbi:MAG: C10 family peptidase, partial [Sedimentisphaerales bacterium]|nr:C10 family peptidase [Sedimentisphaerales bacterium]